MMLSQLAPPPAGRVRTAKTTVAAAAGQGGNRGRPPPSEAARMVAAGNGELRLRKTSLLPSVQRKSRKQAQQSDQQLVQRSRSSGIQGDGGRARADGAQVS